MPRRNNRWLCRRSTRIHVIRGVAGDAGFRLGGAVRRATKVLNQAVERNAERFPDDFAFQLTAQEVTDLKSQIATSSSGSWWTPKTAPGVHRTRRRDALQRPALGDRRHGEYRDHACVRPPPPAARHARRTRRATPAAGGNRSAPRQPDQGHHRRVRKMMEPPPEPRRSGGSASSAPTPPNHSTEETDMNLFQQPARPGMTRRHFFARRGSRSAPRRSPLLAGEAAPPTAIEDRHRCGALRDALPGQVQEHHLPAHGRRPGPDGPLRLQAEDGRVLRQGPARLASARASGSPP